MAQLADNFSKPQMSLLSDVIQWFHENDVDYQPESLYADVNIALSHAHPRFHAEAANNPSKVLDNSQNQELTQLLTNLRNANKEVFVVTNSPFKIVDKGMSYMLGEHWKDYFDVVIISAKKPDLKLSVVIAKNKCGINKRYLQRRLYITNFEIFISIAYCYKTKISR